MNRTRVVLLLAGTAVVLASCATMNRPKPLTIELFDSRAMRQNVAAPALSAATSAMPTSPDSRPFTAAGVAAEASIATVDVASAPEPSSILTASLPQALERSLPNAFDAGLITPPRPRGRTGFILAAPEPPSPAALSAPSPAKPVARGGSAGRQVTAAAPAPQSKQVTAAAPAPTLPAAEPAPSPAAQLLSTAGSASSAPVPAPAGNPYGRLREIYARKGDVLQIGLDGLGFLFLGFPDAVGQADGMSFKSKENRTNKTWFTFQALKIGTYDLDFLRQDNSAGRSAKETVRVHVVSDQDFNSAIGSQEGQTPTDAGPGEAGDPAYAARLTSLGSYEAAVAELLHGYRDGNPGLNDQIAALYMRMGSYDAAGKYYGKNLSPQNAYTPSAVIGMVRIAIAQGDQQGLVSSLKQFLALRDPGMEEPLIKAVRMERARSEVGIGLDLAAEYAKRFPQGQWRDEADYLTAQMLEADSAFRDIARARDLYAGILTSYPESAFADAARQRLQYIDRHFIQVR